MSRRRSARISAFRRPTVEWRADDHLGGIGAHAAQPDDQYVGLSEQVEFLFAEQQLGAFKPIIRIHFQVLCSFYRAGSGGVPAALSCPCGPAVNIRP